MTGEASSVIWSENLGGNDVARVGGKNASLGEMVCYLSKKGTPSCGNESQGRARAKAAEAVRQTAGL